MKRANLLEIKKENNHNFTISLINAETYKHYTVAEITLYFYPYNKALDANSFQFLPFEEYVNDLASNKQSSYKLIQSYTDKLFGILLGLVIAVVFGSINLNLLISVEAIVSILAAYAVGKDLWRDINNALVDMSKNWPIKWSSATYAYAKEHFGTIQSFWKYARFKRYGQNTLMPTKFDFITQSNSKTIELFIGKRELQNMLQTPNKILSIELNEKIDGEIRYMLGCKVALSKRKFFLFKQNIELFQAVENEKVGTVDLSGKWQVDSLLVRKTLIFGALKFYLGSKVEVEQRILDIK